VALPLGPSHAQATLREIHVLPFQRHHLAASQPGFAAQQDDQLRSVVRLSRRLHQAFEGLEAVKRRLGHHRPHDLDRAGAPVDNLPLVRRLQQYVQHREDVVHRLPGLLHQRSLQPLHVFSGDLVQPLGPESWQQM
jgi:hypothetical protein